MIEKQLRYTFELLKQEFELIEVRIILSSKENYSGYFKNINNLVKEVTKFKEGNIYFILNKINDACYSRDQHEKFIKNAKTSTTDGDIIQRDWILIDLDPKRPTGISSTDEEKNNGKETANKIFIFLRDYGFSDPISCDSGNGFHLLYKIAIENNDANKELLRTFLLVLDMLFSNDKIDVDKSVFNASRITKLYGTESQKGNSTPDRPHRQSHIRRVPEQIKITPIELIKKVADLYPAPEKPKFSNNYSQEKFDLSGFIRKHNIQITNTMHFQGGTKYILDHCLFNDGHKGKDAVLFELSNGAIAYKCLHNSCSQHQWQDVRKLYEPNAYDRQKQEYSNRVTTKIIYEPQLIIEENGSKFLKFSEIKNIDRSKIISMPSHFRELDRRLIGFNKGEITLWSGKNGSAKSTIINQIAINAINDGFKGSIFSGELQSHKIKNWIHLQCAGRQFTISSQYEGVYYVKQSIQDKIDKWLDDKLLVYNNKYGNKFEQLMTDIEQHIVDTGTDFIVLDNLMAIDLLTLEGDKNHQQSRFILRICDSVKKYNYHLHLVAHPRKNSGFLRKEDISGTSDLTNAVDNVIIAHRNNNDYKKAVIEFFGHENSFNLTSADNYLEVCKNRDLGVVDHIIGLYFEVESKRLLNEKHENIVYGWQDIEDQKEFNFFNEPQKLEPIESMYDPFVTPIDKVPF